MLQSTWSSTAYVGKLKQNLKMGSLILGACGGTSSLCLQVGFPVLQCNLVKCFLPGKYLKCITEMAMLCFPSKLNYFLNGFLF